MSNELTNYLVVGAVLFAFGALGFVTRRNLIVAILSAEMMLHGVSLNLIAFSYEHGSFEGEAFTAIVLTVAACEAALALALISALYRLRHTLDISVWSKLGDPDIPPEPAETLPPARRRVFQFPRLTPAGKVPEPRIEEPSSHA